jgi:purine nucleosidase
MPITMIGWDISRKYAVISHAEQDRWRAIDTDLARFCLDIQTVVDSFAIGQTHLAGFDLPDPIAMAVALDESVIGESVQRFVTVETGDGPSRGQTVIDHFGMLDRPATTRVVTAADPDRFRELLYRSMR